MQKRFIIPILLVVGSLILYFPVLSYPFLSFDDDYLVERNPWVREFSVRTVQHAFTSYDPELYTPSTTLSFALEYAAFGREPRVFHATNLALHLLVIILVFFLALRWSGSLFVASVCGVVYAAHPLTVEAVAWISSRKDLLAAVFGLSALLAWTRRGQVPWTRGPVPLALFLYLCALLSKPSVITLPLMFLFVGKRNRIPSPDLSAMSSRPNGGGGSGRGGRVFPFFLLSLAFTLIALFGKHDRIVSLTMLDTAFLAFESLFLTLAHFVLPADLSIIYPAYPPLSLMDPLVLLSVGTAVLLCAGCMYAWKQHRPVALGLLFFLIMMLPTFGSFQHGGGIFITADRYAYLPMFGLVFAIGSAMQKGTGTLRTKVPVPLLFAFLFLLLALPARARLADWSNTKTLFTAALRQNPDAAVLHMNLGILAAREGRYDDAKKYLEQASTLEPSLPGPYANLGFIAAQEKDIAHAHAYLEQALKLDPGNPNAHNTLGALLLDAGRIDEAIVHFKAALTANPFFIRAHNNLAAAFGKKGMEREGLEELLKAMELDPARREQAQSIRARLRDLLQDDRRL